MHLIELCAPNVAPIPWPGVGSLSRSYSLADLALALPHADCILVHQNAQDLSELLSTSTLPVVVCADHPSVAQAVACMRAGAVDVVPKALAWNACQAALSVSMSEPKALGLLTLSHTQALEQERLELIGRLSWGLAHEILNPATFVMANLEETRACIQDLQPLLSYGVDLALLHGNPAQLQAYKRQANWPEGLAELEGLIDECQNGMARINNLVNDIKSYGPIDQAERDLDLRRVLQRVLGLARTDLQAIRVSVEIDRAPPVHASPARLASLLSSLVAALLKRPVSSLDRSLAIRSALHTPWVELHLHDSAPLGADEDSVELARTQIGLAFGRELVARLRGELSIQGGPKGLHVRLRLPAVLPGPMLRSGELLNDARVLVHSPEAEVRSNAADVLRSKTLHIVEQWPSPSWAAVDVALIPHKAEPIPGLLTLFLSHGNIPFQQMAAALAKRHQD